MMKYQSSRCAGVRRIVEIGGQYEKTQVLGMGAGRMPFYDVLHRVQTQITEGGKKYV